MRLRRNSRRSRGREKRRRRARRRRNAPLGRRSRAEELVGRGGASRRDRRCRRHRSRRTRPPRALARARAFASALARGGAWAFVSAFDAATAEAAAVVFPRDPSPGPSPGLFPVRPRGCRPRGCRPRAAAVARLLATLVRPSARTAEEDDELPLHAALAADADFHLVSKLLEIDPGRVREGFNRICPFTSPCDSWRRRTSSRRSWTFSRKRARRDADGLHPTQLAVYYDDDDEPAAWTRFVARRTSCDETTRRAPRREPLDRILGKAVVAGCVRSRGRSSRGDERKRAGARGGRGGRRTTRRRTETRTRTRGLRFEPRGDGNETTPEMEAFAESASNASRRRRRALRTTETSRAVPRLREVRAPRGDRRGDGVGGALRGDHDANHGRRRRRFVSHRPPREGIGPS